jgi:phosphoribosylglycinamide formyltransferase-1
MSKPLSVLVLVSGHGSNLQALIDASKARRINAEIVAVISNAPGVVALERAAAAGLRTEVLDHKAFSARAQFDCALRECIDRHTPDLIVLAGFMRVLGADLVNHYHGRMINIHPSLLPDFPGLDTHRRALRAGVKEHGVTVHFVTARLDGGPFIAQARVPVLDDDDEQTLAARVLSEEHRLLPRVVELFAGKRVRLAHDTQVIVDGQAIREPLQLT